MRAQLLPDGVRGVSASPRENYRKRKVQGKAGKREFMASTVNGVGGGGRMFLEAAFVCSLDCLCLRLSLFASPQRELILREHGLQVRITENSWL